ncbi:MAG: hypothetical protein WD227_15375 [Vicinamibacterales bacterium]
MLAFARAPPRPQESATGNIYAGLYYPIGVAAVTFVVGSLLLRESHKVRIWDEVD